MANRINIAAVMEGANHALTAVNTLAPLAGALGGSNVANIATIALGASGVIANVLERAKETQIALTTQEEAKLQAMLGELQAVNDKLAGRVDAT